MLHPYTALDKRRQSTTGRHAGKYHVKLFIDFPVVKDGRKAREQKRYPTGIFATVDEWRAIEGRAKRADLAVIEKYNVRDAATFELFLLCAR